MQPCLRKRERLWREQENCTQRLIENRWKKLKKEDYNKKQPRLREKEWKRR